MSLPAVDHRERVDALCNSEYARLVHFMVQKTGSWQAARDAVHEAVIRLLLVPEPSAVSNPRAYLYRSARNLAIDMGRRSTNYKRIHGLLRHEFSSVTPSPEPALIEVEHEAERLERLNSAIKELRPHIRLLVKWRIWDDVPYKELESRFAAMGKSVNERTLLRWYQQALAELGRKVTAASAQRAGREDRDGLEPSA